MEAEVSQSKRVTARNLGISVGFVVVVQAAALYITQVSAPVTSQLGYSYAPAGSSSAGAAWNVIILVAMVFATTLVAVWLVRNRRVKFFKLLVFLGTAFAFFFLTLLTTAIITEGVLEAEPALWLSVVIAAAAVLALGLSTFSGKARFVAPAVTGLLSAEVGSYFAATIPYFTALLLPVAFSLYDIYAVFKGPLKQLVSMTPGETLGAVSTRLGEFSIGLGDTIFYAMLPSLVLFQFGLRSAVLTMAAIDAGVLVTLALLSRHRLLPGLPIPMALGLLTVLAFTFLG